MPLFEKPLKYLSFLALAGWLLSPFSASAGENAEEIVSSSLADLDALDLGAEEKVQAKECLSRFVQKMSGVKAQDYALEEIEAEKLCELNHPLGASPNKHNQRGSKKYPELKGLKGGTVKIDANQGRCEATYEAVKSSYLKLLKSRGSACLGIFNKLKSVTDCKKDKEKSNCDSVLTETMAKVDAANKDLAEDVHNVIKFVDKFPPLNAEATTAYNRDRDTIRDAMNNANLREQEKLKLEATVSYAGRVANTSENNADNVEDYLRNLQTREGAALSRAKKNKPDKAEIGPLQREQNEAEATAKKYISALQSFLIDDNQKFMSLTQTFNKNLSENQGRLETLGGYVAPATQAAAPFVAPAAAAIGPSISGGGGGNTAAAAAVLAAGASVGAAALNSAQSSAIPASLGASPVASAGNSAPARTPLEAVPVSETAPPGNPSSAGAPLGATPIAEQPSGETAVEPIPPLLAEANSSTPSAGASSSKDLPKAGKGGKSSPATGGPATPAGDDVLKSFGGDLKPAARPKKTDALGDVSNLLGQMKDLFNFDEGASPGVKPFDPNAPLTTADQREPASLDDLTEQFPELEEESASAPEGDSETITTQADPLSAGMINKNLFLRVHSRHRTCMEKGWVLSGLGGIPE